MIAKVRRLKQRKSKHDLANNYLFQRISPLSTAIKIQFYYIELPVLERNFLRSKICEFSFVKLWFRVLGEVTLPFQYSLTNIYFNFSWENVVVIKIICLFNCEEK